MLVFSNLSVVFLGLGILLSILAIVLFFVYRIPQIQKVLSGRAANEERSTPSGNPGPAPGPTPSLCPPGITGPSSCRTRRL